MNKLYDSENGCKYKVISAPDVSVLRTLGVFSGGYLEKRTTYGFGGPVLVDIDGREVAIGKKIAKEIEVQMVGR